MNQHSRRTRKIAVVSLAAAALTVGAALAMLPRASAVAEEFSCTLAQAPQLTPGSSLSVPPRNGCEATYAKVRLRIGDRVTFLATAGSAGADVYLVIPNLTDSETDGVVAFIWPEDCHLEMRPNRSATATCVVAATATYPIQVTQFVQGTPTSLRVVVKHSTHRYIPGTCNIFGKPPVIKLNSKQLYNPYDACSKQKLDQMLNGSLYGVTERWAVAIPRAGIYRFHAAAAVKNKGVPLMIVRAGTDPADYSMNGPKTICSLFSGSKRSPATATCVFRRAGRYVISGEETTDRNTGSESYGGSTVLWVSR